MDPKVRERYNLEITGRGGELYKMTNVLNHIKTHHETHYSDMNDVNKKLIG